MLIFTVLLWNFPNTAVKITSRMITNVYCHDIPLQKQVCCIDPPLRKCDKNYIHLFDAQNYACFDSTVCEINYNIQRQAENSSFIGEDSGLIHYTSMPNKVGIKI